MRRLTTTVDSLVAKDEFSGVVSLTRAGTPVFQRAYGMADRDARRPNDMETAFNLGSINKMFTATAIRQLEAQGKVHQDSTLITYLPDYPNKDVARRITLRQMIAHRSGIGGDIFSPPPGTTFDDLRHTRDYLKLFVNEPLTFEPGSQARYANAGYIVLGAVVEHVSGEDYYDYVRRHIYEPAEMSRTAHWRKDSLAANTAIGYTRDRAFDNGAPAEGASWRRNESVLFARGSSAGGGYSTAGDLLRYVQAVREGKLPSSGARVGHGGGAPGINGMVAADLRGGYDLVVLANLDPPAAERVARVVRDWLGDAPPQR